MFRRTLVFLARSTALVSVRGSCDFQPLWLSRTRYNIKEFSSAVERRERQREGTCGSFGKKRADGNLSFARCAESRVTASTIPPVTCSSPILTFHIDIPFSYRTSFLYSSCATSCLSLGTFSRDRRSHRRCSVGESV